jgi:hypothetical protein
VTLIQDVNAFRILGITSHDFRFVVHDHVRGRTSQEQGTRVGPVYGFVLSERTDANAVCLIIISTAGVFVANLYTQFDVTCRLS